MNYHVELSPRARRALSALDPTVQARVADKLLELAADPRPPGSKRLKGQHRGRYRVRVGDWRIVYSIEDQTITVLVLDIAKRDEVYSR